MKLLLALTALALAACYSPKLDRCQVTCEDSAVCPGAQVCLVDKFCHQPGDELLCNPDAEPPPPIDAMIDAGPDAEPPDAMPPPNIRVLTAAGDFACVIDEATELYCWGYNRRGAIGIPTTTRRVLSPMEIGGGPGWTAVDAGDEHICGIKNGEVYCWGSDDNGETADATPNHLAIPTLRAGTLTGWTAIAAGRGFTCGIRDDGGGARHLYCWGADGNGQIGNGASGSVAGTTYAVASADDGAHDDWATVSASVRTVCATRDGGEAYCWGQNNVGQAGVGSAGPDLGTPFRVAASPDGGQQRFSSIAAGYVSTCAIGLDDGGLYCWGDNSYNLLGQNGLGSALAPRRIGTATDWTAISVYYYLACGSRSNGVYCWGNGNAGGVGDGTWVYASTPQPVVGLTTSALVSAGYMEACAAPMGGGVLCWGENNEGELGIGETSRKHVPQLIPPAGGWTAVAAGRTHTCGIRNDEVLCWGWDGYGQISGVIAEGPRVPTAVVGVPPATEVAVGDLHTCALADDGGGTRPWCWGFNTDGQVGVGLMNTRTTPVKLDVAGTWHDLVATVAATCALDGTTRVCWGYGTEYGFGNNATGNLLTPTAITEGFTWKAHALGRQFGCGIRADDALACWGLDDYGAQGDGASAVTAQTPHVVDPGTTYVAIAAHSSAHVCGIQSDGDLACWGRNNVGQAGSNAGVDATTPTLVPGPGDWSAVAAGGDHTCGVKDAELWCWGNQEFGQLGIDDDYYTSHAPVKVVAATGWDELSAGEGHTCGILDGDLYCWGANVHGQIGDGTGSYNTPQVVTFPTE